MVGIAKVSVQRLAARLKTADRQYIGGPYALERMPAVLDFGASSPSAHICGARHGVAGLWSDGVQTVSGRCRRLNPGARSDAGILDDYLAD
jgi:hypothetical protein